MCSTTQVKLAYVQTLSPSLQWDPAGKTSEGGTSWVSDGDYAVVLMKADGVWLVFCDVAFGQTLFQTVLNPADKNPYAISHISRFNCPVV